MFFSLRIYILLGIHILIFLLFFKESYSSMIRSLLLSTNPQKLTQFYGDYGLKFKMFKTTEIEHYPSINSSLCIIRKSEDSRCLGGLLEYKSDGETEGSFKFSYDKEKNFVYSIGMIPKKTYNEIIPSTDNSWITIIRNSPIEETKEFYKNIEGWVEEKHSTGPLHYSLTSHGQIFEIYPNRKNKPISMEFIVTIPKDFYLGYPSESFLQKSSFIEDLDGRQIRFICE